MSLQRSSYPLVWIDCEMTGLDRDTDTIMSICCFVTNEDLKLIDDEGFETIVHHDKAALDRMDEWCINTHGKSGLTAACIASTTDAEQAAANLLTYIQRFVKLRRGILAGNSIHCDKEFLSKGPYKQVTEYLSYRIFDVSTIKEAARRWASDEILGNVPRKQGLHQAREDILESIEEAQYYRKVFFTPAPKSDA